MIRSPAPPPPPASPLPGPAFYFPLRHGRYDVSPGLSRFGKDLGGGDADAHVFQIDETFHRFRAAKLASRAQGRDRYVRAANLAPAVAAEAGLFIARRLAVDHPRLFTLEGAPGPAALNCGLTGDSVKLTGDAAALDALACQIQEDLAIVSTAQDGDHWISYLHVCLPNGWAPAEKAGRSFAAIHEPVAGMEEMNRRGAELVNIMTRATDGLVRFAWGVTFDDRLDHHPDLPRIPFDPANPKAWLRVERQTIWGFQDCGAALFTIRTYLYDCDALRGAAAMREPLVAALRSMPPASRRYKGIADGFDALVSWLASER